eukprot:341857-Rhodomonas_salina.2
MLPEKGDDRWRFGLWEFLGRCFKGVRGLVGRGIRKGGKGGERERRERRKAVCGTEMSSRATWCAVLRYRMPTGRWGSTSVSYFKTADERFVLKVSTSTLGAYASATQCSTAACPILYSAGISYEMSGRSMSAYLLPISYAAATKCPVPKQAVVLPGDFAEGAAALLTGG